MIYDKSRFRDGIVEVDDLHHLTPHEFEEWCGDFLSKLGYTDIEVTAGGKDGGKDIICKEGEHTVYVECKRYSLNISNPYKVHNGIIEKLAGAMIHDGVKRGMVITTGIVTDDARVFAKSLPCPYSIQIIDSDMLIEKCLQHKIYLTE